jgi:hypothetical protein
MTPAHSSGLWLKPALRHSPKCKSGGVCLTRAEARRCEIKRSRGLESPLPWTEVRGWHSLARVKLEYVTKYAAYGPPPGALALKCRNSSVRVKTLTYPNPDLPTVKTL